MQAQLCYLQPDIHLQGQVKVFYCLQFVASKIPVKPVETKTETLLQNQKICHSVETTEGLGCVSIWFLCGLLLFFIPPHWKIHKAPSLRRDYVFISNHHFCRHQTSRSPDLTLVFESSPYSSHWSKGSKLYFCLAQRGARPVSSHPTHLASRFGSCY